MIGHKAKNRKQEQEKPDRYQRKSRQGTAEKCKSNRQQRQGDASQEYCFVQRIGAVPAFTPRDKGKRSPAANGCDSAQGRGDNATPE